MNVDNTIPIDVKGDWKEATEACGGDHVDVAWVEDEPVEDEDA